MIFYKVTGERYFYDLLNDLQDVTNLTQEDFIDWGEEEKYVKEIGIGECAGVVIDLIATLFFESEEKIDNAKASFGDEVYSSAIYYAYLFIEGGKIDLGTSFSELIYEINKNAPTKDFAVSYIANADKFLAAVRAYREAEQAKA